MTSIVKSATLTALMIPAAAIAGLDIGQPLGATETDVRAALVDLGYEVQEIEIEDGEIEAEVTLNGIAYEVEVAMETGLITEIELEDDEDDDNDS